MALPGYRLSAKDRPAWRLRANKRHFHHPPSTIPRPSSVDRNYEKT